MRRLVSRSLAREAYRDHLAALLRFHAALEPAFSACQGLASRVPDLEARRKTPGLRADLLALGVGAAEIEEILIEWASAPPPVAVTCVADGLGALYVTEGATLGGRLLARHLADSLGVDATSGAAHFLSYGEDRGPMWQRYKAALDAFGEARPDQQDRAVASARATFAAFTRALPTYEHVA